MSVTEEENIVDGCPPAKKTTMGQLDKFVSKTSEGEKQMFDKLVAKFFYACNIPFSTAENKHFEKLITSLRPSYKPPTRKALSGELLTSVYDVLLEDMKVQLKDKHAALLVDEWSNVHNEPITVACVQVSGKSYFIKSLESGANAKTAEYLTEEFQTIIETVKDAYGCSITSVVADNAKNMEKMQHQLAEDSEDSLITYSCSAHWLNLLGQDVTPDAITKHVVEVQKYFRNHHAPGAWLRECHASVKPQLPGDTLWSSQLTCMNTYLRNHPSYLKIANDHREELEVNIVRTIRNFQLFEHVKHLVKRLKPICKALNQLQSDQAITDARHIWLGLLSEAELKPHITKLKARFQQAILPVHMVAYLLHPKFCGKRLTKTQKEAARQWIKDKHENMLVHVISFETKSSPFPSTYFTPSVLERLDPAIWWKGVRKACDLPEAFSTLIIDLSCPGSSAGIERIFSSFSYIHNKLRNRLGLDTASKLLFCYRMLCSNSNIADDD